MNFNFNKTTFFIVQARSGSSRLPGKMLMPFSKGKTIPELIIQRLVSHGVSTAMIIIATTDSPKDDELANHLAKTGCRVYRGDENNVLKRFIDAAKRYHVNQFFRICADNPFLNMNFISEILNCNDLQEYDYVSHFLTQNTPAIKTHFGFFAEYTNLSTLETILKKTNSKEALEHVTPYIYEHPDQFNIKRLPIPDILINNQWLRLTIDTKDDFHTAQTIYENIDDIDDISQIIKLAREKGLKEIMQENIKKQTK